MTRTQLDFKSFDEFYHYYLGEHRKTNCRRMHVAGALSALACLIAAARCQSFTWLMAAPLVGYAWAWTGHLVFEKNRPATLRYPVRSFLAEGLMVWQCISGKLKLW